jgi:hypothetical protein
MKNRILLLCFLACSLTGRSQTVARCLTTMPDERIPGIRVDTRKDLIDFYQNGKRSVMPAAFGGKVQLKVLEPDFLLLQTSESADLQLKILTLGDSTRVLAVVRSAAAPWRDSRVSFFTMDWKPLQKAFMPRFAVNDFLDLVKAGTLGLENRLNEFGPRLLVDIRFKPAENAFVAKSSLRADLEKAQSETLGALVRDSVVYRWNGTRFLPE